MKSSTPLSLRSNLRLVFVVALTVVFVIPFTIYKAVHSVSASIVRPAPDVQADFVRIVSLTTNDLVYSPTTKMLYASVPSSVGAGGNSIKTIDPANGSVISSVFIGSEPDQLALGSDGTTLYAGLNGAYAIRRFDISTQTAGAQFNLGSDSFFGLYRANDIAVAPGNPNLIAVARYYLGTSPPEAGVAIFDNGVQRPATGPGHIAGSDYLAFSASPTKLYGGGQTGLSTLTIDANGVTVTGTASLGGTQIKFDNGLVFARNGQVIDPNVSNGTLKGTFAVSGSSISSLGFVTEAAVGRAYYLVSEFSTGLKSIRVFDTNSFVQLGSIPITGLTGDVNDMVRWGSNGLAFRTTTGQLVMVQSSLISSADPIPTPTAVSSPSPSPTPTPPATFVRQIPLTTNDLIYNANKQSLYASIPGTIVATGNSIVPIDPVTATVGNSVFVGSEPNKLALSEDQQTMYVALNGAGSVRRFDLNNMTAGLQFSLGNDVSNGPRTASALAVMPGAPGTVAVNRGGAAVIYDDGVARTQTQSGGSLAFLSPTTLYSSTGPINKLSVSASGLSLVKTVMSGSNGDLIVNNGLVYMGGGAVVDVEGGGVKGTFGPGSCCNSIMALDAAANRAYFLSSNSPYTIRAYDLNTFLPVGSVTINLNGSPTSLVRWGSNGLALRTSSAIVLIQSALVNAGESVPAATPSPSPTPTPSPAYIPTYIRKLDLVANDLAIDPQTQRIYASVPSYQGASGNSITTIDPQGPSIGPSTFIGSEPNKLALADDNKTLYTVLDGASAIRRFDYSTQTAGLQFSHAIPGGSPADLEVMPGSPQTVVIPLGNPGVAIYDNGVKRPNQGQGSYYAIRPIEFNGPGTLYGYDSDSSGFELVKFSIDSSGATVANVTNNLISGFTTGLKFANGFLYSTGGRVVDPEAKKLIGTFQGFNSAFAIDTTLGRAFMVSNSGSNQILTAYDLNTFLPIGSTTILTGISGTPGSLIRWGTNGLAFRVTPGFGNGSSTNPSSVYLVQSALVSSSAPIPTGVQFSSSTTSVSEGTSTVTLTVNRTGDVTGTTSVDWATSDGTATAGSDYTASSGTVTFAPGQLSKTITVPIINDAVYEGPNETFNVTLSNAGGGALLGTPATIVVTIQDNESQPSISIPSNSSITEGNSGTKVLTIPVTINVASTQTISVNYTTVDGTALVAGADYVSTSGTLTFPPGTTAVQISVIINGDTTIEPDETFLVRLSGQQNAFLGNTQTTVTISNDDSSFQFSAASYSVAESGKSLNVTVTRSGNVSSVASVTYATTDTASQNCAATDGKASARCDYITALGQLNFVAGQTSKTITVLVSDDGFAEGAETFNIALSNPSVGILGANLAATITITDNDSATGSNPTDVATFFVRQNYLDFLNREPDQSGYDFWSNQIIACGSDTACIEVVRINVSAAFFVSIEFQQTGYLVERMYKVAYGNATGTSTLGGAHQLPVPIVRFNEFLQDTQRIGQGVVVLQTGWEQALENNKQAYALEFVQSARFLAAYPTTMTPAQFVDALNTNAGNVLSNTERTTAINRFSGAADISNATGRAQTMRQVAEDADLVAAESNRAFVLAQFFGYLRRNPNDLPDSDYTGYDFWLDKLNQANGNYINAEMVKAFISSDEYRKRFGP